MSDKVLVPLPKPFEDSRGYIQCLIEEPSGSCQAIFSKAGAVRAGHYHLTDAHFVYLAYGMMDYYHKPVGSDGEPECVRVTTGQMIYTPPNVWHRMNFLAHTLMFVMAKNSRTQERYEEDTVRSEG